MKRTERIYTELHLQTCIGILRKEFKEQGHLRVDLSTDKPRTVSQNKLIFALYQQIGIGS